jgi:predicted PurR-regulated permease PerM
VTRIERLFPGKGWVGRNRRTLSVVVVYLLGIIVLASAAMTIGQRLTDETLQLIENLPDYADTAREEFDHWTEWYEETVPPDMQETIESNIDNVGAMAGEAARTALTTTFGTVTRVLGFIAGLALLPLWLFYVLKDDRKALDFFYRLWPDEVRGDVRHILGIADGILGAYIRGQLFLGFVIGIVTFIGLWLLDVQYAGALAVVSGIFELVPIIGPWLSFVAAAIVVLATEPEKIWWIAGLFLVIQQLENTLLVPKIQGDAVELNPAVIMVLIVVGGALFGIIGIIVIVPLAAIARDVFIYVYKRLSDEGNLPETPL